MGQQPHYGSLAADESYARTVTVTVPNGLVGSYYLIVNSDSARTIYELDHSQEFAATASPLSIVSQVADLAVTAASAPSNAFSGTAVLVNWTVTNQGTGDTAISTWQDYVYIESGSTLDGNGILIGSFAHTGLLNPGDSYSQSQQVTLPLNLSGNYHLFVVTNKPGQSGVVFDPNSGNNTSPALGITLTQQLADLRVTALTAPALGTAGTSATVQWTVTNNGAGVTNSNYWYDDVWLSTNTTLGSGGTDVYVGTLQHSNVLGVGQSYNASLTVTLPQTVAAGHYHFIVATDRPVTPPNGYGSSNLVLESIESNNEAASSLAPIAAAATPHLVVSNVTVPASAITARDDHRLTVTNNGPAATSTTNYDTVYLSSTRF